MVEVDQELRWKKTMYYIIHLIKKKLDRLVVLVAHVGNPECFSLDFTVSSIDC